MTTPSALEESPFKLLEIKFISANDLPPVSRALHTYVVAWVHPDNKLITPVDHKGNTNPTWNYRMVFRVDDNFLRSNLSAVMIEIYNISRRSNRPIGTTCVPVQFLLNNNKPSSYSPNRKQMSLQICRPSGDFKGVLNISVNLVNTTIRNRNEADDRVLPPKICAQGNHSDDEEDDGDEEFNSYSEPENGTVDSEMQPMPADQIVTLKNLLYSTEGEYENWSEDQKIEEGMKAKAVVAKNGEDRKRRAAALRRRHSVGGGLFSCFTSGLICGSNTTGKKTKKTNKTTKNSKSKSYGLS